MPYNTEIHAPAPFPSGPLPTEAELRRLAARSRNQHIKTFLKSVRRMFNQ